MLNQAVVVGRIKEIYANIILIAIPRSYKNNEGKYDSDLISIQLPESMVSNILTKVKEGQLIGVKGALTNDTGYSNTVVLADKITFLSSEDND